MRIIGIDYGTKRVGVAISDRDNFIATPLCAIKEEELFTKIDILITQYNIKKIVVGVPYGLNRISEIEQKILIIISQFREKYLPNIEIIEISERYTSKIAEKALYTSGFSKKCRSNKENIDMMSAAIILQSYLDKKLI